MPKEYTLSGAVVDDVVTGEFSKVDGDFLSLPNNFFSGFFIFWLNFCLSHCNCFWGLWLLGVCFWEASDIVLLDVQEQTSIASYFVIATVNNERQARAIEEDLLQQLRIEQNVRPLNIEGIGGNNGGWVLLDYGDVIIHLFTEEARTHYDLEELWSEANIVMKVF